MCKPSKGDLLDKYASKEPKQFEQFDSWYFKEGDSHYDAMPGTPDRDGVCAMHDTVFELMIGPEVRVLIEPKITKQRAAMMLRKVADEIERHIPEMPETVGEPESDGVKPAAKIVEVADWVTKAAGNWSEPVGVKPAVPPCANDLVIDF